ncbi:MAG: ECF-type sigma factor [Isosphaerales bacterium]
MNDVTQLISAMKAADPQAASQLLPMVYDELRRLAAVRMAHEPPGQTLDATALVHEAYLRLVGGDPARQWDGRAHFFAAAAEAMRRILVERARGRKRLRRGGDLARVPIEAGEIPAPETQPAEELLAVDAALERLAAADSTAAELVKLRYFAGLSIVQAAEILGISPRTADRLWSYARAWLRREIGPE